jgi:iron complex outermembrane receptor protein
MADHQFAHGAAMCPFVLLALLALPLQVRADNAGGIDIADLSIEELANIQITSVSKKPERLADAAASVFVITADDIRRSGAASLPEILRLAPNLQVAARSGYEYSISARGLNGSINSVPNKLLVLIDGRSVYTPTFSGVTWDMHDLVLEDIARIEVVSGPGGTLWGVNAVNGVINIITRAASDSTGRQLALQAGQGGVHASFRQGGGTADDGWRVFGKHVDERHSELASGARVDDARHQSMLGFRRDWRRGVERFSVHGNAFRGRAGQPAPGAVNLTGTAFTLGEVATAGAYLSGQWIHPLASGGSMTMQAYVDHNKRSIPPAYADTLDIADLQFQHSLAQRGRHQLVWGASLRHARDDMTGSQFIAILPGKTGQTWASVFAQDEIALRQDLRMIAGARVEHNDYTGIEFLPTLRLSWQAAAAHSLWTAASRTVRAPSRLDADVFVPGRAPHILRGGPEVQSEVAKVFELGYRGQPLAGLSLSVTAFFNRYDHLRTQLVNFVGPVVTFDNMMEGKARGLEAWGSAQLSKRWRLSAGLNVLHEQVWLKPGGKDAGALALIGHNPSHTAQLRSTFALADDKELEVGVRKVDALDRHKVPGYTAVDARFGWRLRRNLELSLAGQNLNGKHAEFGPAATRSAPGRVLALKLVWQE